MRPRGRWAVAAGGVLAFGLVAGWLHGDDGGLRASIGNVSAPWLFIAIIPAWWSGSSARGALLGAATTLVALVGFYVGLTATMYGHLGTAHGLIPSFSLVLSANRIWFAAGLISGPLGGALAGYLGTRHRPTWLGVMLGALMVGEVVLVAVLQNLTLPIVRIGWGASDPRVYVPEALLGALTIGVVVVTQTIRGRRALRD